jgi:Immunoglobulin domain
VRQSLVFLKIVACSFCIVIQVFWIQKSSQTILTSDDRVEVDNIINEIVDGQTKYDIQKRPLLDMTTYMLIIRRLVLTDAGTYTCQINVKAAMDHPSKDGVIVVQGEFLLVYNARCFTRACGDFLSVSF